MPKLSPRGVIVVDNTLRGGRTWSTPTATATGGWRPSTHHVQADERTENVLLSVRDGVTLIRLAGEPGRPL